ncbi:MAG: N-acetylmuramoyl-L-alanine amidase [Halocynthiibacter sp.]|jgi:N-acetylmuramoyl-L-alanine amidase
MHQEASMSRLIGAALGIGLAALFGAGTAMSEDAADGIAEGIAAALAKELAQDLAREEAEQSPAQSAPAPAPQISQSRRLSALARVLPQGARLFDKGRSTVLELALSQPVPFRIFTVDAPPRLVVDFSEVDWAGFDRLGFEGSDRVGEAHVGLFRPGWSRMVLELNEPLALKEAGMQTGAGAPEGGALVHLLLAPVSAAEFAAEAGVPADALYAGMSARKDLPPAKTRQSGDAPLVVVLDPGHGGIDPGAENGEIDEADLMLTFARELQEMLVRAGQFEVVLTRSEDVFVPLEERVSIARRAGADVFLSLHADALAEGRASGATIYTLSDRASDVASQKLAERHDRADLIAGVDLSAQDDVVANVLMDLARTETAPRADALADALVAELAPSVGMHKRPRLEAGFSVLKAPDIPSVLIELGFLSSPRDLGRLSDPAWRAKAVWAIRDALIKWGEADAAQAQLLRQ